MRSSTSSRSRALPPDLATRLLARDRDAVSEALNLADDRRPAQREQALRLLDTLERRAAFPGAVRVGVTGAPGAGKSTLLDALLRALRTRETSVAVVAVDPSSRHSGGALLGDRIRMRSSAADPGVFIRSMAARDQLGGISDAARAGVTILAAVFDWVLVETVGVGQSESEVAGLVDTLLFVLQPGSGDALQFMKAGLIELPDVFAVNKSDLGGAATRTAGELESGLSLGERPAQSWRPPVCLVSARDGSGVEQLVERLEAHRRHLETQGELRERRDEGRVSHVTSCLAGRYGSHGLEQLGGAEAVGARVREDAGRSAFVWVEELGREIEEAPRKPD